MYAALVERINTRLQQYKDKVELLESAREQEMAKTLGERRVHYLLFLAHEKNLYTFLIAELEILLQNGGQE